MDKKLCVVGSCIGKNGNSDATKYDIDGNLEKVNAFPFKLQLDPMDTFNFDDSKPASVEDFLSQLVDKIPANSTLYNIKAYTGPEDTSGIDIGTVQTDGPCVTSLYGDMKLYFKHTPIEQDAALKPEWKEAFEKDCYCNPPAISLG